MKILLLALLLLVLFVTPEASGQTIWQDGKVTTIGTSLAHASISNEVARVSSVNASVHHRLTSRLDVRAGAGYSENLSGFVGLGYTAPLFDTGLGIRPSASVSGSERQYAFSTAMSVFKALRYGDAVLAFPKVSVGAGLASLRGDRTRFGSAMSIGAPVYVNAWRNVYLGLNPTYSIALNDRFSANLAVGLSAIASF